MRNKIYRLKNITYTYPNQVEALKKVNMEVLDEECLGIIGPNGAGKTTLLMIMDLLLPPNYGELYLYNIKIDWEKKGIIKKFRKKIGLVFQDPDIQLFSNTVWEDIAFAPYHFGMDKREIPKIVDNILEVMEIIHLKDRHPYNLSYGEKKIVAISTILSFDPDIILLDEPTSNLDGYNKKRIINIIRGLKKKGKTLIIASHDLNLILELCDRLYLLNKTIVSEISPTEISDYLDVLERTGIDTSAYIKKKITRC